MKIRLFTVLLVCLAAGALASCGSSADQGLSTSTQDCRMKTLECGDGFQCQMVAQDQYECLPVEDLSGVIQLATDPPETIAIREEFTLTWTVTSAAPVSASHVVLCEGELAHCGTSIYYAHRILGQAIDQDESTQTSTFEAVVRIEAAGSYSIAVNADLGQGQEELIATPTLPIEIYVPVIPTDNYPDGPYGTEVGEIFPRTELTGFADTFIDEDVSGLNETSRLISSAEFYQENDPDSRLLLITISAEWCPPCTTDAKQMAALYEEYYASGLRLLSVYFQDADKNPVSLVWLENFAREFGLQYPIAYTTPDSELVGSSIPTRYLVDPATMEIIDIPSNLVEAVSSRFDR